MSGQCPLHSVQGRKIWFPRGEGGNAAQLGSGFTPGGSNGAREPVQRFGEWLLRAIGSSENGNSADNQIPARISA